MLYLPPLRRLLLPAVALLIIIVFYRTHLSVPAIPTLILTHPPAVAQGIRIPIANFKEHFLPIVNTSKNHLSPPDRYYYSKPKAKTANGSWNSGLLPPILNANFEVLFRCPIRPNQYTKHIRLPNIIQNISHIPQNPTKPEARVFWNPTIIALPYWSRNQYLIVSRVVTDGNHQANVLCETNVCYTGPYSDARQGEKPCTADDIFHLGHAGGMRCVTEPMLLSVPPTPAEYCEGKYNSFVDIPGFHDPRIFWSGRGEPLMMVNSQSRYACFGLWLIDLRTLYPSLETLLSSSPASPSLGPLKSYQSLTELTRNPPSTRAPIEKNWCLFFPSSGESFIHYDLSTHRGGRTFAKLLGGGLTTTNLTDPLEIPCIPEDTYSKRDIIKEAPSWHQATNSLRLIICYRSDPKCMPNNENTAFFAIVHKKWSNLLGLPMRYERYVIVWSAVPPFGMLGISQHPILLANETASGFPAHENWDDDPENAKIVASNKPTKKPRSLEADPAMMETYGGKGHWANFTYTVSIAYASGRKGKQEIGDMNVGYLDDEVILGIGVDDGGQVFSRVKAVDLLQCLKACPGRRKMKEKPREKGEEGEEGESGLMERSSGIHDSESIKSVENGISKGY